MRPLARLATLLLTALGVAACGVAHDRSRTERATAGLPTAVVGVRFATVTVRVPSGLTDRPFDRPRRLRLPAGWTVSVWAHIDAARLEAWTPEGRLLVSAPADGTVTELTPNVGARPHASTILSGLTSPQGLAFDRIGGHEVLYVAESNELDRYAWNDGHPGTRRVLVPNLPDTEPAQDDVHRLKNVVVGRDHTIYVDVASSSNASPPTSWHGTPRATVIAYRPTGRRKRVFATGVRNGDGLAFAPDRTLWTAVNERDSITYPFHGSYDSGSSYGDVIQSYVNEHPPDEVARLTPGRNLGWPYCNPDPDVHRGAPGTRLDLGNMGFDADTATNPSSSRLKCAALARIQRGLPAHSAPLGFHFLQGSRLPRRWAGGAVVAAHGSWDREPPRPPVVYWMPWQAKARTLGPAIPLVSGFQGAGGTRWGRTADAVAGPDGALYVTDDTAGAVYRIVPGR